MALDVPFDVEPFLSDAGRADVQALNARLRGRFAELREAPEPWKFRVSIERQDGKQTHLHGDSPEAALNHARRYVEAGRLR